jgi:ATP-dependent RNA helicase DDX31/DBP7
VKYLSEFHARPRDLDRSERAARVIKESCASDHLFAREDEDFNDNDGDDDTTHLNDEVHDGKATNNTSCASAVLTSTTTSTCAFSKLGLHPKLVSTLTSPSGHFQLSQPTIIQSRCIVALVPKNTAKGKTNRTKSASSNLFIQSETGSGKTLAYLLPILQHLAVAPGDAQSIKRIDRQIGGTRCIILCPTRELATQTYTFANHLCNASFPWIVPGCFSGGEKRKSEKARLRKGISILIGTPGRLLDHLSKTESLLMALKNKLEWLVLDEVDRLLDAGLGGQVEQIVQHLRSNQPGAGPKRDGVTWRSVLVSATVTADIEGLAKTVLGGEGWLWARGHAVKCSNDVRQGTIQLEECDETVADVHKDTDKGSSNINELDNATPRQLAQLFIVVNAKLRLAALIAFLSARAAKGERTVVFLSTCDSVDYHHALLTSMESILGSGKDVVDDEVESGGIFGKTCPIFKLHGDIPHNKRMTTINDFNSNQQSAILLATDVAGRGLNFPSLDWIVQYDPPCETNDYCHRAGRSARAGNAGHALLFLLPSERQYIDVLRLRGLKDISALSLSSTLSAAAALCTGVTQEFEDNAAGNKFSDGGGETFTTVIQNRLEQCVIQNDLDYKASIETKFKGDPKQRRRQKKDAVGPLLEGARKAFAGEFGSACSRYQ